MSGTINRTPCPNCGNIGGLYIDTRFTLAPLGSFSLSGAQMKATGQLVPVLKCTDCSLDLVGNFDGQQHATFKPGWASNDTLSASQRIDVEESGS